MLGDLLPPRSGDGETPSGSGIGVLGRAHPSGSEGVLGLTTNGVGVAGVSRGSGFAGGFEGNVFVRGSVTIFGLKAAAVPHPDGSHRVLYAVESPESWFEDFGRARLVEGQAQVELDPDFAAVAHTEGEDYHVFLTPEGASNGLYVSGMGASSFEVREQQDGSNSLSFSYRVVAKRKDVQGERFEPAHLPPPVADDEILDTVIQDTTIEVPRRGEQPQPPGRKRR